MPQRSESQELLTTGQVATLLGTTARHVVNLCLRGELPYTMAGTHRRIRRVDALALAGRPAANQGGPLTDDQLRSLWLHRAAAGLIARDPVGALTQAKAAAEQLLARAPDGASWLRDWLGIIARGPEAVMRAMTSIDPLARELRQNSPFLGLLSDEERRAILAAFQATRRSRAGRPS
jgi:excisionase family DNA binding protein